MVTSFHQILVGWGVLLAQSNEPSIENASTRDSTRIERDSNILYTWDRERSKRGYHPEAPGSWNIEAPAHFINDMHISKYFHAGEKQVWAVLTRSAWNNKKMDDYYFAKGATIRRRSRHRSCVCQNIVLAIRKGEALTSRLAPISDSSNIDRRNDAINLRINGIHHLVHRITRFILGITRLIDG